MMIYGAARRAWAEVDLKKIEHNYKVIRGALPEGVKLCCVVKANAYAHGALEISRLYERWGAEYLAVSSIDEAMELRRSGIRMPILNLGFGAVECAVLLSKNDITQCVYSSEYAQYLSNWAVKSGVKVKVHIKLDTGMARIGFVYRPEQRDDLEAVARAATLPGLVSEGIFTHFADANSGDVGDSYTRSQFECFYEAVDRLERLGVRFDIRHCANSGGIFDYPAFDLDMVRAGGILFGVAPDNRIRNLPRLEPAMTLKAVISCIKELAPGESVGYGRTYIAERKMKLATIPIGYADGIDRALPRVWVSSTPAPVVGRVCMDQLMVDVSDIDCRVGDEVVIFGGDGTAGVYALSEELGTISYDTLCRLHRVPVFYE